MIYKVVFKYSYVTRYFDFHDAEAAIRFAETLVEHETEEDKADVCIVISKEEPCEKESSQEQ